MLSPMTDDLQPNLDAVDKLVELFVGQGLDGIYVLGSTGQGPALQLDTRKAIAARAVAAAGGRVPVVVHVGSVATADCVELAQHAAEAGAAGVSSVAPIYYTGGVDVELEHYRQVAAATDLPFMAYINEAMTGRGPLPIREHVKRLVDIPNAAAVKYTTFDMNTLGLAHAYAGPALRFYSGMDQLFCHAVLSGAHGAVGTFYNVFGLACHKMRAACTAGRVEAARSFMLAFQRMCDEVLAKGVFWFLRQAMQLRYDIDVGPARALMFNMGEPWDEQQVRAVCDAVDEAAGLDVAVDRR